MIFSSQGCAAAYILDLLPEVSSSYIETGKSFIS